MRKNIVLMTDFGDKDNYVAILKGVILTISPDLNILDLTHNIQAQNIKQAAFILRNSINYFPKGTIFVSVIDPGVGSNRKAIAVKTENYYFIAPNNGILSYVLEENSPLEIVELNKSEFHLKNISNTFHGRDIFAPVSAHLSLGIDLNKLGNSLEYKNIIKINQPYFQKRNDKHFIGEIIYADHFGNLITSLDTSKIGIAEDNFKEWITEIDGYKIKGISKTFSEVQEKQLLSYIGSFSYLEIALRNSNAKKYIKPKKGTQINLYKSY